MKSKRTLIALALFAATVAAEVEAQTLFGSGCAGASGVTPTLAVNGTVKSGSSWTLEVTAPGGLGLGYLLVGSSNLSASALGGLPLPLDLGVYFGRASWSGCPLNVDPNIAILVYSFDPNANGGVANLTLPGWDFGTLFMQAVNIDPDLPGFTNHTAGVSSGFAVRRTPPSGFVAIEPGTFEMGSNASAGPPYNGNSNSQPVHTVTIGHPFWIGQHEVTQAEYIAQVGTNPSKFLGPNRPVDSVTWHQAVAYCAALTAAETLAGNVPVGYEFRLPTQAEWEYACRAGSTTEFAVGAGVNLFCPDARFVYSNHTDTPCFHPNGSTDVGSYPANNWRIFDMHGNVWEWCLDSFTFYSPASVTDPFSSGGASRVFRGGGWSSNSSNCRSAYRSDAIPQWSGDWLGFRVVLAPVLVP